MNQTCNIVELFSGIGSQAKALKNLGYKVNTLGTCEWDLHAFIAYDAIHSSPELPETIARMGKAEILKKLESYPYIHAESLANTIFFQKSKTIETAKLMLLVNCTLIFLNKMD